MAVVALLLPSVISIIIYKLCNREISVLRVSVLFLFSLIFINGTLRLLLFLIGMKELHITKMGNSFLRNWSCLGSFLGIELAIIYDSIEKERILQLLKRTVVLVLPVIFFFGITYFIYTPTTLFLSNINEFAIPFANIFLIALLLFFLVAMVLFVFFLSVSGFRIFEYLIVLLFAVSFSFYLQGNFLNPKLPSMNGQEIDWSQYRGYVLLGIVVWSVCLIGMSVFFQKRKTTCLKVVRYISLLLCIMQIVSLVVLILNTDSNEAANDIFTKEGEFDLGKKANIILFIEDTLDADAFNQFMSTEYFNQADYQDFTYFDNTVSGGAATEIALPILFSGIEYDPMQDISEYRKEVWGGNILFRLLQDSGFDARIYSDTASVPGLPVGFTPNYVTTDGKYIDEKLNFSKKLLKLSSFYLMPVPVKRFFWMDTHEITQYIKATDNIYYVDDVDFYNNLVNEAYLKCGYEKAYRAYHLYGAHPPYIFDENMQSVPNNVVDEMQVLCGITKEIGTYIQYMKELDIYENSMIVIVGDHGRHLDESIKANPALLVKIPNQEHEFEISSAPIHFRNLVATIAEVIDDDNRGLLGPNVFDLREASDAERLQTVSADVMSRINGIEYYKNQSAGRFIVYSTDGVREEFDEWNPNEINRIAYRLGETIDFRKQDEYTEKLTYRLYFDEYGAMASNELSICLELDDIPQADMRFFLRINDIMGESQRLKLYADGIKCEEQIISKSSFQNGVYTVQAHIPKDAANDGQIVLRMVFPGAITPNMLDKTAEDYRVLSVRLLELLVDVE